MEDNKIWRVENMESTHNDSEIDESKTDDDEEEMSTPIQDTLGNPYKIRN